MSGLRRTIQFAVMGVVFAALALALVVWRAYETDPIDDVPKINQWGEQDSGPEAATAQSQTVQLVSDEGIIWLTGKAAHVEFTLLSDEGKPFGLPLKIELQRNSVGVWDVRDNAEAHYASLPVLPPVTHTEEISAESSDAAQNDLDQVLMLAAENRKRNQAADCALLANTLSTLLNQRGFPTRNVAVSANPKNSYDSHALLEFYSAVYTHWILIDPTFVGFYADLHGNPLSASDAYRLTALTTSKPDRLLVQFEPFEGALPPGTEDFGSYYLSPLIMFRHIGIGFGSGWAMLGALDLPFTGDDLVHIPTEIPVAKGIIPPIIEYRVSSTQLSWRIGRGTSGLARLASEGGIVSDGATMNPDLISTALIKQLIWSAALPDPDKPSHLPFPDGCSLEPKEEVGARFLRIRSGPNPTSVRVEFHADQRFTASLRVRAKTQSQGVEFEYFGFIPLFDTRFPLKPGNWQVQSSPFFRAAMPRVGLLLHLPANSTVDLSRVRYLTAIHDVKHDGVSPLYESRRYRTLNMKLNLRNWLHSML
jgi:hypothetical protein